MNLRGFQRFSVAFLVQLAIGNLARLAVVNSVAVAQIETFRGAKSPDGVLDKTWEYLWKALIEGPGIDPVCGTSDDLSTATVGVAGRAIPMGNPAAVQNACAVQKIVHQGIDGDHGRADLAPAFKTCGGCQ